MIRAILTDIEGTTSSLSFVRDVLFPYSRDRLEAFLRAHGDEPEVRRQIVEIEKAQGRKLDIDETIAVLRRWIDEDRKATPLKSVQGMIWEAGYRNGDFTGHVYEDAQRNLRAWHDRGLKLYVFSSGSVQGQKLLFSHSDAGDLTPLFDGYFDTRMGTKREPAAYRAIRRQIGLEPEEILFLSDVKEELDAAREEGMYTTWLVRDTVAQANAEHPQAASFDEVRI